MAVNKASVAVVDDDLSVRRALERLLRAGGFTPVLYESAEAFLEDAAHARVDCVVLDIHLGRISGLDLREMLAAGDFRPPIIFITAMIPKRASGCIARNTPGIFASPLTGTLCWRQSREPCGIRTDSFLVNISFGIGPKSNREHLPSLRKFAAMKTAIKEIRIYEKCTLAAQNLSMEWTR